MVNSALAFSNCYPAKDALQILKSDTSPGVFGLFYQVLGYNVVSIFAKSGFFFASIFKQPLGCLCTFALKLASQFSISGSQVIDVATREHFPVTINSNGLYADGDGDFQPQFDWDKNLSTDIKPKTDDKGHRLYDAG